MEDGMSRRKKKNKVVKLTEEDYSHYIMSLKDEEPVEPVRPVKGKYDDTGA